VKNSEETASPQRHRESGEKQDIIFKLSALNNIASVHPQGVFAVFFAV
jgi:hypothetical protein